ncbi:hypothetical protein [Rhizorhabdus dicambivorans]|uniref:Uncharacterized protein n=1 Tax=Rhizorhabdus dicambivorans TaxID=1850238 RepID=A0A2A4FXS1_9SPHN|nr:hypothetical protein [Rhizorhabdus dicambivorans]ATE64198.1 hypothetical protein CMV14_07165 [Rhizorhabdus dicambivorans]PCE42530.1 hypothetical protein COO09_08915 [Rhizorhabdus dicambivorans]
MNQEQQWLREHSRKRRIRETNERRRRLIGLAGARFIRRVSAVISIICLLLISLSVLLNWGKFNWADLSIQIALSVLALVALNGVAWLIEWLLRHIANAG